MLRQPASFTSLNFTAFRVGLKPTKSVLSAESGQDIGFGGPRQTLLRIAPTRAGLVVKTSRLQMTDIPVTLTATGVTTFNALFGAGLADPAVRAGAGGRHAHRQDPLVLPELRGEQVVG